MSQLQSYSTDGSELSAACCATLAYILFRLINLSDYQPSPSHFKELLEDILKDWSDIYQSQLIPHPWRPKDTVNMLPVYNIIEEICESRPIDEDLDGIWNWKQSNIDITHVMLIRKNHIRYVNTNQDNSYSPDSLSLGLHLAYHHITPSDYLEKTKSMGVNMNNINNIYIVTGQIIGAYYGYKILNNDKIFNKIIDGDGGGGGEVNGLKKSILNRLLSTACLLYLRAK